MPGPNELQDNAPNEHPGTKEPVKNPNPRANSNLPDDSDDHDATHGSDSIDKAGEEITDGEAG